MEVYFVFFCLRIVVLLFFIICGEFFISFLFCLSSEWVEILLNVVLQVFMSFVQCVLCICGDRCLCFCISLYSVFFTIVNFLLTYCFN